MTSRQPGANGRAPNGKLATGALSGGSAAGRRTLPPLRVSPPDGPAGNVPMTLSVSGEPQARPRSPSEKLQPKRPPAPPKGRRPKAKRRRLHPALRAFSSLLTLLLVLMAGAGIIALVIKKNFSEVGPLREATVITIPRGRGLNAIAAHLQREGIVSDSRLFVANVYYKGAQSRLKAGKYKIPRGASINEVVDRLVQGRAISYKVTLVEGQTSQQIVERLNAAPHMVGKITLVPPEGSLLPDTYVYAGETSRRDVLDRMRIAQQKLLDRLWQNRQQGLPIQSKQEALILASIVEKETGQADERGRVAAVFINRLKKGIKLQSDPTIIYGLVGGKGKLGHPIRRSELNRKTAFNTYQIARLPPTPICNPGTASIMATLNPAVSDELFFVADGTGGHIFARTLKEHNANVRNWRKIEKLLRAKRKSNAAAAAAAKAKTTAAGAIPLPGVSTAGATLAAVSTTTAAPASAKATTGAAPGIPLPVRNPKRVGR